MKSRSEIVTRVRTATRRVYDSQPPLLFHDWLHVEFVARKAVEFANSNGSDPEIVEIAAILHDVNYLVQRASGVTHGTGLRHRLLTELGASQDLVDRIEDNS